MKICVFTRVMPAHGPGGMQKHTIMLAKGLVASGQNVDVITTAHPDGLETENIDGVNIYYLPGTKVGSYSKEWWEKSIEKFVELNEVLRYDLVWGESIAGYSFAKARIIDTSNKRVPFVVIPHGTAFGEIKTKLSGGVTLNKVKGILRNLWSYVTKDMINHHSADVVIAIGETIEKQLIKEYFLSKNKVMLRRNGIDTELFKPAEDDYAEVSNQDPREIKVILAAGRLNKEKGIQLIIEIMPELKAQFSNTKFIVVGSGDYLYQLNRMAEALGVKEDIIFLNEIKNELMPYLYNRADLFVMPTLCNECMPYVVVEAMACGTPVIASNIGGVSTMIEDGIDGLTVKVGDKTAFYNRIVRLLRDRCFARELGNQARRKVIEKFSYKEMISITLRIFEGVVNGSKNSQAKLGTRNISSDLAA